MKLSSILLAAAALAPLAAIAALLAPVAVSLAAEETYQIDGVHSTVIYKVKHLNVGNAYGRFNTLSGTVLLDPDQLAKSSFQVEIKADSIDTGNAKRDTHLKSPDFFAVKQFPTIAFKSKEVKPAGENAYDVTGDLTMHGVTKPLTIKVMRTGSGNTIMGVRTGFETTFTVKRSDFGMKTMEGIGDDVQVTVSGEAVKK
jgi:polyisoprenoid-binding protein YceI